jgi:hypothetical protein
MNLAVILGFYLLGLGCVTPGRLASATLQSTGQPSAVTSSDSSTQQNQGSASASQPQAPPSQSAEPAQPAPPPTGQTPNSAVPPKPAPNRPVHHKKTNPSNCSNAPTALNPAVGNPADSANSTSAGSGNTGSGNAGSTNTGSTNAASANAASTALKPCPPPKKVVRNGGSKEPSIELVGGTTAEQASDKSSTEQLTAATEENLKKIAGLQLNPSQQEMVSQIKQFMEQSRTAVAAGDPERGRNLALKAHLLSDELVKP